MFGSTPPPQNEETPFHPRSPYAVAKVYAYWATVNYRESFEIHASNGILFNHESPRRGKEFVTRKITATIPRLMKGEQKKLYLGNLDAKRDWGHARDYVRAMQMMLRHTEPHDLVIGTGQSHSVRDFLDAAFAVVDLDWEEYVEIDPNSIAPPRSISYKPTSQRPRRSSDGNPRSPSTNWSRRWSKPTSKQVA